MRSAPGVRGLGSVAAGFGLWAGAALGATGPRSGQEGARVGDAPSGASEQPSKLVPRFGTGSKIGSAGPPPTHPVIVWQASSPSWGQHGWWWGGPGWCGWGPEWGYAPRLGYWLRDDYGPVMMGAVSTVQGQEVDPNLGLGAPATPEPAATVDEGEAAMRRGAWDLAARTYERRLRDEPERLEWGRLQAVALTGAGRLERAAGTLHAVMARAPELADRPMDIAFLGDDGIRRLVVAASGHANSARTPEAWLLVACLMQAEGRRDQALRMVEQARASGLSEEVAGPLDKALGGASGAGAPAAPHP